MAEFKGEEFSRARDMAVLAASNAMMERLKGGRIETIRVSDLLAERLGGASAGHYVTSTIARAYDNEMLAHYNAVFFPHQFKTALKPWYRRVSRETWTLCAVALVLFVLSVISKF